MLYPAKSAGMCHGKKDCPVGQEKPLLIFSIVKNHDKQLTQIVRVIVRIYY